jgi:hypothetical protein
MATSLVALPSKASLHAGLRRLHRYCGLMTRRKLLRVVEIAELLGVSKQRADQLRREPDFPAPVDR